MALPSVELSVQERDVLLAILEFLEVRKLHISQVTQDLSKSCAILTYVWKLPEVIGVFGERNWFNQWQIWRRRLVFTSANNRWPMGQRTRLCRATKRVVGF